LSPDGIGAGICFVACATQVIDAPFVNIVDVRES
jgi:hypothetical protein